MKRKGSIGVLILSLVFLLMTAGCTSAEGTGKSETEETKEVTTEGTTDVPEEEKVVSQTISSGEFEEENHYSITLPKAKWEKTGSMEEGSTTLSSNKGDVIKISYYEGKDSKTKRKEFPSGEESAKKKLLSSKKDELIDFDRMAVGGKSDGIIRMYYGIKAASGENKYSAVYIISGEDATYIAEGTTTSKKEEGYNRLKECVKSLDLFYSFD